MNTRSEVVGIFQNTIAIPPKRDISSRMLVDLQKSYAVYGMKVAIQDLLQNFLKFSHVDPGDRGPPGNQMASHTRRHADMWKPSEVLDHALRQVG